MVCTNCGGYSHEAQDCSHAVQSNPFSVRSIDLQADQWPVVLKSLEIAAGHYHEIEREQAERAVRETLAELRRQLDL